MDMSVLCVHCCAAIFGGLRPWFDLDLISNWGLIPDSTCTFVLDDLRKINW